MARSRSPNRDKAFDAFRKYNGKITTKEIAILLNEKEKNIEYWRSADRWNAQYNPKGGAPLGNTNASGAPIENQYARTEGWYSKYYPTVVRNLIKEAEKSGGSPLEIQWAMIMTKWVAIVRAQKIMYVKDKDDMTKELKKTKVQSDYIGPKGGQTLEEIYREEEYELQFAWDKQANFLNAQSRAMSTLSGLIKRYEEMLHADWDLATEEQKLRVNKLKVQLDNPEFKHRKEVDGKKLELERERFEHIKEVDKLREW